MTDEPEAVDEVLDLTAIMRSSPPARRAVLDAAALDPSAFGIGEILELSKAVNIDPAQLGAIMRGTDTDARARVAIGLAWIIARRVEPELTFAEVQRWQLEVRGEPAGDPTPPAPAQGAGAGPSRRARRATRSSRGSGG